MKRRKRMKNVPLAVIAIINGNEFRKGEITMDYGLLKMVIERKQNKLKTFTLEQMGVAGVFSGFIGLVIGEFYTKVLGDLIWQTANVFIYAAIGATIVYFTSRRKKEDLQVDLMLLEHFEKNQSK